METDVETGSTVMNPKPGPEAREPDFKRMVRADTWKAAAICLAVGLVAAASLGTTRHAHAKQSQRVAVAAAPASTDLTVSLREWGVSFGGTQLRPARYTLEISNSGHIEHELIAFRTGSAAVLPTDAKADVNEEAPGIQNVSDGDNLAPGGTQMREIDLTKPGTYVFLCNLPGHYKLGMHTVVTVLTS